MSIGSSPWIAGWDPEPDRAHTLQILDVARRYYEDGMSQAEIAEAIRYSRATVGRILEEARRAGVVQIRVTNPLERSLELERVISARFGIANVRVVPGATLGDGVADVGESTALLFTRILRPGTCVALSVGRIHQYIAEHIRPAAPCESTFVQLVGSLSEDSPVMNGAELCLRFARAFGGGAVPIDAPMLARSVQEAGIIRSRPAVAKAMRQGAAADMAIIGVGAGFHHSAGIFTSVLPTAHIRALRKQGAVGHILAQFFDKNGKPVDTPLNDLVIGLPLEQLKAIPHVIGVAAGSQKAEALRAALRGGLLNALIVDRSAAQSLAYSSDR